MAGERWNRLTLRQLATLIEREEGFVQAWFGEDPPYPRRYLLGAELRMQSAPLGLEHVMRPAWPTPAALAKALGLTDTALWRLTRPPQWQRGAPLSQQHHAYTWTEKRRGGWRLLEVPEPYLRALQHRILTTALDDVPPHDCAFGFVKGRSVRDHAARHAGQFVVLKFDLEDFFTSVRASRIHALWATLGYPECVATLLTRLCTTVTPEPVLQRWRQDGGATWRQVLRAREAHLAQGAPSSPALANLCAFRLDLRLDGLAYAFGARYSRYADDVVLSGPRSLLAVRPRLEAALKQIVEAEGFALNLRKSRCETAAARQTVCHIVVNQHPNLRRAEFDCLKAILHACARDGPSRHNLEQRPDWRAHLQGRVAWAAQLNPDKAQRLQKLLVQIDWSC